MFYYLSWVDARTKTEVIRTTNASLNDPKYNNGNGCMFPCQSSGKIMSGGCCDTVYLPHVEHTNIYAMSAVSMSHMIRRHHSSFIIYTPACAAMNFDYLMCLGLSSHLSNEYVISMELCHCKCILKRSHYLCLSRSSGNLWYTFNINFRACTPAHL